MDLAVSVSSADSVPQKGMRRNSMGKCRLATPLHRILHGSMALLIVADFASGAPVLLDDMARKDRFGVQQQCAADTILASGFDHKSGVATNLERFGENGWQVAMDIARGPDGSLVLVGNFDGALDFGGNGGVLVNSGADDVFIVKFNSCGAPLWRKSLGDAQSQSVQRVAVDAQNNVLVIGQFRGAIDFGGGALSSGGGEDIFLAKLDSNGNHLWSQHFGDANDQFGRGVTTDVDGNVFIAGSIWGSADFGGGWVASAGWEDIFLAKFDSNGSYLWARRFGDQETQEAWDLASDSTGNVVLTGYALGDLDFGNGLLTAGGMPDAVVAKFDAGGNALWSHRFGDSGMQFGQSVATDSQDNVVLTGEVQGSFDLGGGPYVSAGAHDLFAAKFAPDGTFVWQREFGDAADQSSMVVAVDPSDNILLTGMFEGTIYIAESPLVSEGLSDAFVSQLDQSGQTMWARRMGDMAPQAGTAIAASAHGDVVVAGKMYGAIEIDGFAVASASEWDMSLFLASFSR
jgi:hypothetical protein